VATFAFVKNGTVRFIETVNPTSINVEKWIALFRSEVLLVETTNYDVMPGDLYLDGKFYKKNIVDGTTTLVEDGVYTHPTAIRFAGIMDGEVVGQYGRSREFFENQQAIDDFVDIITSSNIVELTADQSYSVKVGWLYNGTDFTNPGA